MKTVDPVWMIDKQEGVSSLQLEQLSQLTKHRHITHNARIASSLGGCRQPITARELIWGRLSHRVKIS
jgi:hypothetical protein